MSACLSDVIRAVSLLTGVYPTDLAVSALKRLSADDILDLFARVQQATESRSTALLRVPGADAQGARRAAQGGAADRDGVAVRAARQGGGPVGDGAGEFPRLRDLSGCHRS